MKKILKALFLILISIATVAGLALGMTTLGAGDDPCESYERQIAEAEDSDIALWFEHSFKKVYTSDTTPSGMDTYSVYMAKNEVENAQFVLYSDMTKDGLTATVTDFKNEKGDAIPSELFYEMYVTTDNVRTDYVLGATALDTIIREGETPDPVVPLKNIGAFRLNGGKSQAFFIKLRTSKDTPAGWYSAQLDIKNSDGETVKTATVFCCVWDVTLPEETALKTGVVLSNDVSYGGSYKNFYDYLLDNRIVAMDPPGGLSPDNPYLVNPRVNAIRVTYSGGGENGQYGDIIGATEFGRYTPIYNELSNSAVWNTVKDKFYFYIADEPVGAVWNKFCGSHNMTVDTIRSANSSLLAFWPEGKSIVPYHENHPYPYFHYDKALSLYAAEELRDSTEQLLIDQSVAIWCPQIYAFTPKSELSAASGYDGMADVPIRELSGVISGLHSWGNPEGTLGVDLFGSAGYYDWSALYGETQDRIRSEMAIAKEEGEIANSRLWAYSAGHNSSYTYANHLVENSGLQTKIMFWQYYQNDIEGYLYYAANCWSETAQSSVDNTVTGAWGADEDTHTAWKLNRYKIGEYDIFGNGVLFYGAFQGSVWNSTGVIGSLRVEIMRDSIEEHLMLTMLEDRIGERAAKDIVAKVSKNVANYLSLNNFSLGGWDPSMDEYDIMEAVRRELGSSLEAAEKNGVCNHSFDEGEVVLRPTCLKIGTLLRRCEKCKADREEDIPALHAVGECFEKVSGNAPTCLSDGKEVMECTVCGFRKTVETAAFHNNPEYYEYSKKSDTVHNVICAYCDEIIDTKSHSLFNKDTATCTDGGEMRDACLYCEYYAVLYETEAKGHSLVETTVEPTCTENGYTGLACRSCDYTEAEVLEATGHSFVDGACTACGEADPDYVPTPEYTVGDINADGAINGKDSNQLKKFLSGSAIPTETEQKAADIKADGAINGNDANILARFLAGALGGLE